MDKLIQSGIEELKRTLPKEFLDLGSIRFKGNTYNKFGEFYAIKYFGKESYEKMDYDEYHKLRYWAEIFLLEDFLEAYPQLNAVQLEIYSEVVEIHKSEIKKKLPNIVSYASKYLRKEKDFPFFLNDLTTLKTLSVPELKVDDLLKLLKNNPNISTLHCTHKAPYEILSKDIPNFILSGKMGTKYEALKVELFELKDVKKEMLMRLFLTNNKVEFKPLATTLLAFLNVKAINVRKEALKCFHEYYSEECVSLEGLNIWLSGSLQAYKTTQIKEMLVDKNAKLSSKKTAKTDLLVVGLKPKLENIPSGIKVISALAFEALLSATEERGLDSNSNEDIAEKLQKLLFSTDETNVMLAMIMMEEGGIPKNVFEIVCGFFKVHASKKVREKAKGLIVRHGGEAGEGFLSICGRRNYIFMDNDEKPKKDLLQLELIEGFDVELFAYILVVKQNIAKFYLATKESIWAKKAIVERINKNNYGWIRLKGKVSSHFKLADKINSFYVDTYSKTFEEMPWLKKLTIENKKADIVLLKEATLNLSHLSSLTIVAKSITIEGSLSIAHINLEASKIIVLGKLEANNELILQTKELLAKSLVSNNSFYLTNIKKMNDDLEVFGSFRELDIDSCNFSNEIYRRFFLNSVENIKIFTTKKFILDESVNELNTKSIEIAAVSILIKGEKAFCQSDKMSLKTKKIVCKEQWQHNIKTLEVVYCDVLERLLNDSIQKLLIRYDFVYDYYEGTSIVFLIPEFLREYANLEILKLEAYSGSSKAINFESYAPLNIKELYLKDLKLLLKEKLPTPRLEVLGLDDVILNKETKEHLIVPSLRKINYSEYESTFDFDIEKHENIEELEVCFGKFRPMVYPVTKVTMIHNRIEEMKPSEFPLLEEFTQEYFKSKDLSGLIGFKHLKVLNIMTSEYRNTQLLDIEKLQSLETLKLYQNSINYGKHEHFSLPQFIEPLKIKRLELKMLNLSIDDLNYSYFSNLEELVLDDVLVSNMSVFKIPSLKKIIVVNAPSVNCPINWLSDLENLFVGMVEVK